MPRFQRDDRGAFFSENHEVGPEREGADSRVASKQSFIVTTLFVFLFFLTIWLVLAATAEVPPMASMTGCILSSCINLNFFLRYSLF